VGDNVSRATIYSWKSAKYLARTEGSIIMDGGSKIANESER